jgi:hypothetical protein
MSAARMAADDLAHRGDYEAAAAADRWYFDVADATWSGADDVTLADLPDAARERTLDFMNTKLEIAEGEARRRPVSAAAIRKRDEREQTPASRESSSRTSA